MLSRIAGTAPAGVDQAFAGPVHQPGPQVGHSAVRTKDDTAVNFYFGGRVVASIKEAVCKGTLWALRREAGKPGSAFWFKGGPRPEQSAFAPMAVLAGVTIPRVISRS